MFTLIIRDCALSASKVPISVSLKATPSFPACAFDSRKKARPVPDSWAARDISAQGTLEVSLLERISKGRIGLTYSAHVISATANGSDITDALPESICLKFTKPPHSRSLAREAWFYQLAECQGTSIPHCHGFFSSTFSEQTNTPDLLLPWPGLFPTDQRRRKRRRRRRHPDEEYVEDLPTTPVVSEDCLPDDKPMTPQEFWDTRNFKGSSPWNTWNPSTQDPTISVLVLELLGESCSEHWPSHWHEPREGLKEELTAVMEDVSVYGLLHDDVTAFNLLRFTGSETRTPQARCPRHDIVHEWRIIDFDRSFKIDMKNAGRDARESPGLFNAEYIGYAGTFWGYCM